MYFNTDLPAYSDTLGTRGNVSLYPDMFYYKKGQLGYQKSVTVTRWLYTVSLTVSGQVCNDDIFATFRSLLLRWRFS